jgi:hypothetical protein
VKALAAALVLVAAAASAQPAPPELKKWFDAGVSAYEQARYAEAAQAFEQAYKLSRRPPIVFALAQSQRRQYFVDRDPRRIHRALELYREYLELAPNGNRAREAREQLSELGPIAERLSPAAAEPAPSPAAAATSLYLYSRVRGARGRVDTGPLQPLPLTVTAPPGSHAVYVEAPGFQAATIEVVAVEGELVPVEARLRELPGVLTFEAPAGAALTIDGRPFGDAPLAGPLALPPGRHLLGASQRGRHRWRREIELGRGEEERVTAELAITTQRRMAWWFLGGAAVLLAGSGVFGLEALEDRDRADAILTRREQVGAITAAEVDRYNDLRQRSQVVGVASLTLLGAGVLAGATGGLLYLLDTPREDPPPARPRVTPTVDSSGLGVRAIVPF